MTTTPRKSNDVKQSIKLYEIATLLGGEMVGDRNLQITGVDGLTAEKIRTQLDEHPAVVAAVHAISTFAL